MCTVTDQEYSLLVGTAAAAVQKRPHGCLQNLELFVEGFARELAISARLAV